MSPVRVTFRRTVGMARGLYTTALALAGFLAAAAALLAFNLDAAEGTRVRLVPLWTVSVAPVLPVLAAVLGMDVWSDERKTGRVDLLLTAPVRERDLVFGKFLGVWAMTSFAVVLSHLLSYAMLRVYCPTLLERVTVFSFLPGVFALMLQGALWSAVAVAASACFRNAAASACTAIAVLVAVPRALWCALMAWAPQGRPSFGEMPLDAHAFDLAAGAVSTAVLVTYGVLTVSALLFASKTVAALRCEGRGSAGLRFTTRLTLVLSALLAAQLIALAYRLDATLDVPIGGEEFRFSPRTRTVLASSQGSVTVTAFMDRKDARFREVGHFLRALAAEAEAQCGLRIDLQHVDPTLDLGASSRLIGAGAEKDSLVFERDGRLECLRLADGFGERNCISLIERMTVPFQRSNVYWTTGHGEASFSDVGNEGVSRIARELEWSGYGNRTLDLADESGTISNDCALVVIAGARNDFSEVEMNRLNAYLNGPGGKGMGGRLLVLLDSDQFTGMQSLLSKWEIRPVARTLAGVGTQTGTDVIVRDFSADHAVSAPFAGQQVILERPVAFERLGGDGNRYSPLLNAGDACLAAAVESGEEVKDLAFRPTRIIAVGDSGFIRNWSLANDGNANRDFFLNCVKYLSGRDALTQSGAEADLLVSKMDRSDRARFVVLSAIALPFFVFVVMALAIRRRRVR